MADWKTDTDLYDIAERLGKKIISMYNVAGVYIPNNGPRQNVVESIRTDAEVFASLDPRKIVDEFERMQRAARDTGEDAVAKVSWTERTSRSRPTGQERQPTRSATR